MSRVVKVRVGVVWTLWLLVAVCVSLLTAQEPAAPPATVETKDAAGADLARQLADKEREIAALKQQVAQASALQLNPTEQYARMLKEYGELFDAASRHAAAHACEDGGGRFSVLLLDGGKAHPVCQLRAKRQK